MDWLRRTVNEDACSVRGWWARRVVGTRLAALLKGNLSQVHSTVFQAPEWIDTLAEAAEQSARGMAFFVAIGRCDAPASMVLPLVETVERSRRVVSFTDFGLSDYNAPILLSAETYSADDMSAVWAAVKGLLGANDLVHLTKLPEMIDGQPNPFLALPSARRMSLTSCDTNIFMPWTECEAQMLPEDYRGYLRSKRRRKGKNHPLRFQLVSDADDAARVFDVMASQRKDRLAALGAHDVLSDPVWRDFYAKLARPVVDGGITRLFSLESGNETIATLMGLARGKRFHVIMLTFSNGEHSAVLPGLQLLRDVMAWAAEAGFTTFDFTIGNEEYKAKYAVTRHPLFEIVEPLSLAGLAPAVTSRAKAKLRSHPALHSAARFVASRVATVAGDRR